jgi:DNA polymerase III sliding clamp (beta) subunit (PCNA family)
MELNISRSELKASVAGLSRIIPGKVTVPVLAGVRFEADQTGTVRATATDLEQTAVYRFVNTTSVAVGAFVLPLPALKELTRGADREHVELKSDGQQVQVTNHVGGHQIRFTLNTLPAEEWPEIAKPVPCRPAEGFLEAYRRLLPFASSDETRYAINHICVDVDGKGERPVAMVAVDGRRLSVWNSMAFDLKRSVLVPSSRFLAWTGLTGKVEIGLREDVTPRRGKNPESSKAWFGLKVGSWEYVVREPDVSFPNWRQVIPDYSVEPEKVQSCVFTDQDADALHKILPGFPGHDGYNAAIVMVGTPDGRLIISGRGKDSKQDTVLSMTGGSRYEGKGGQIGINREYLLDALAAGFRTFSYVDEMSPLVSRDQKGGTHVVMPVRVEHEAAAAKPVPVVPVESGESTETVTVPAPVTGETNKEEVMPEKTEELSALDRLQAAFETAKQKIREANSALVDLAGLIKDVAREDKQRRTEVESVRSGLAKLQSIKV